MHEVGLGLRAVVVGQLQHRVEQVLAELGGPLGVRRRGGRALREVGHEVQREVAVVRLADEGQAQLLVERDGLLGVLRRPQGLGDACQPLWLADEWSSCEGGVPPVGGDPSYERKGSVLCIWGRTCGAGGTFTRSIVWDRLYGMRMAWPGPRFRISTQ